MSLMSNQAIVTTAFDLSNEMPLSYLSTGSEELDSLLDGGIRMGEIIEISGPSGSGKSQLVMSLASNCGAQCSIIDTSHGICPERLVEMMRHSEPSSDIHTVKENLSNITIANVHNIFQLCETLESIPSTTKLLIVDCISLFIAAEFGKGYAGQAAVESITKLLRSIARMHNMAVVVTNGIVSNRNSKKGEGRTKPALGRTWSFTPDRRLMLSAEDRYQIPQRCSSSDYRCSIQVISAGIQMQKIDI